MPRLAPDSPQLIASPDGAHIALVRSDGRLELHSAASRARIASIPVGAGLIDIGFCGSDRLLAFARGEAQTQVRALAVPALETIAQLTIEGQAHPLAFVGARVLCANEAMQEPRVVTLTSRFLLDPIALRVPLKLVVATPDDHLLTAGGLRDAQLECWDIAARRALYRINLPLMQHPQVAGFAARRRLLWIASAGAPGYLEVFRFSDGRLQLRVEFPQPIVGVDGRPDSPRLIVATRAPGAAVELTSLDFSAEERRVLPLPSAPAAFCLAESATPSLVLLPEGGDNLQWVTLERALPAEARPTLTAVPAAAAPFSPPPKAASGDWRARLGQDGTRPSPATASESKRETPPSHSEPAPARSEPPPQPALGTLEAPEAATTHWREELCTWAAGLLAAPRRELPTPVAPAGTPLGLAIAELELDDRAARALALVYAARLLGDASGVPAATVARALGGDQAAWNEALGLGALARAEVARARAGRLQLRAAFCRFLDGATTDLRG
jgi:hypothetical protein